MSEWRPIATAPKDGTFVLLFVAGREAWCPTVGRWNDGQTYNSFGEILSEGWGDEITTFHVPGLNMPTHWMPLPAPPSTDDKTVDIVERLRAADISGHGEYSALVREAADKIERLRSALQQIVAEADSDDGLSAWDAADIARRALRGNER